MSPSGFCLWLHWSSSGESFLGHVVCANLSMLLSQVSELMRLLLQIQLAAAPHCHELYSWGTTFHPLPAENLLLGLYPTQLIPDLIFCCGMPWFQFSWLYFWLCHIGFGMCNSISIHILMMWIFLMVHIPLQLPARTFPGSPLYLKWIVILFSGSHFF